MGLWQRIVRMKLAYKLLLALWLVPAVMFLISVVMLNTGSLGGAILGIAVLYWTTIAFVVVLVVNIIGFIVVKLFF